MMQSLVASAKQCGALPHWVNGSEDTTPMEGDHTPNVIAGAYSFGARDFDVKSAAEFMWQAQSDKNSACNDKPSIDREVGGPLAEFYFKNGYIPTDLYSPTGNKYEIRAGSMSIEAAITAQSSFEFIRQNADKVPATASNVNLSILRDRSGFWTKTFDPDTNKLYGKTSTGGNLGGGHNHFHEASEYNYLWTFAHDWTKLIRELAGKSAAITELDRLMSVPSSTPFTGEDA